MVLPRLADLSAAAGVVFQAPCLGPVSLSAVPPALPGPFPVKQEPDGSMGRECLVEGLVCSKEEAL